MKERRVIVTEVLVKVVYGLGIFVMLFAIAFIGVIAQYESRHGIWPVRD